MTWTAWAVAPILVLGATVATQAEEVDLAEAQTCLTDTFSEQGPLLDCINDAHAHCALIPLETPAVVALCFHDAETAWQDAITAQMAAIAETNSEDVTTVASIETRYDLLSALLQCSRVEELQLAVGSETEDRILMRNAQCKANATAMTYARLFLRAGQ